MYNNNPNQLVGKTIVAVKSNMDERELYSDVFLEFSDGSFGQIGSDKSGFLVCVCDSGLTC